MGTKASRLILKSKTSSKGGENRETGLLWTSKSDLVDGLCLPPTDPRKINKMIRKQLNNTAGLDWYDMPAPTMTPELKMGLQLLKLKPVMEPSKHYKRYVSRSIDPKYFQIGTVVEPAEEFYQRLTKKNRKTSLADQLVSDPKIAQYRKRKVREIEEMNRDVHNKKWKRNGKDSKKTTQRRN